MGGFFSGTQPSVIDTTGAAARPFVEQAGSVLSQLLGQQPGLGGALANEQRTGAVAQKQLTDTLQGAYMPGQSGGNPFLNDMMNYMTQQQNIARRQLAASAQRSGALNSTDYLNQAQNLETGLMGQRGNLFSNLYEQERARQQGAASALSGPWGVSSALTRSAESPFNLGMGLVGATRGQVTQPGPSPFASLLSGIAPFIHW